MLRRGNERIGVVALVGDHALRLDALNERGRFADVGHLASGQTPTQRVAQCFDCSVNLGTQSAPATSERLVSRFFWAPAAC